MEQQHQSDTPTVPRLNSALATAQEKWGVSAMEAGYQIIPDVLFRGQQKLGLDVIDVVIVLNIALHWWDRNDLPYPRPSVIAKRMNVTTRTVERHISDLEDRGFLRRLPRQERKGKSIRPYDLRGLAERLDALGRGNLAMRRSESRELSSPPTMEAPLKKDFPRKLEDAPF